MFKLYSLILSILSIIIIGILLFFNYSDFTLNNEIMKILVISDFIICGFFFIDYIRNIIISKSKRIKYIFTWGIIDLLSSIPAVDGFRFLRIFRIFRIFKAFSIIKKFKFKEYSKLYIFFLLILSFIVFPILILAFEMPNSESNIKTAEDAIWWTYITITTVGYGDFFPVTTMGRLLASILILFGVGLFGTVTAYMSEKLLKK